MLDDCRAMRGLSISGGGFGLRKQLRLSARGADRNGHPSKCPIQLYAEWGGVAGWSASIAPLRRRCLGDLCPGYLEGEIDTDADARAALLALLAALGDERFAGHTQRKPQRLVHPAGDGDAPRRTGERGMLPQLQSRRSRESRARILRLGQEEPRAARGIRVVAWGTHGSAEVSLWRKRKNGHSRRLWNRV